MLNENQFIPDNFVCIFVVCSFFSLQIICFRFTIRALKQSGYRTGLTIIVGPDLGPNSTLSRKDNTHDRLEVKSF